MLAQIIFWFIVFYISFKVIKNFIIPIVVTGFKVRSAVKSARQSMEAQQQGYETAEEQKTTTASKGDYIDFEEIK